MPVGKHWAAPPPDDRFSADGVYITASIKLGENGDKVDVKDLDLTVKLQDVHIEMECLFPRLIDIYCRYVFIFILLPFAEMENAARKST